MIITGILKDARAGVYEDEHHLSVMAGDKLYHLNYLRMGNMAEQKGAENFALGQKVSYPVKLIYVHEYENAAPSEKMGLTHTQPPTGNAVVIGKVKEKIDAFTYRLDLEKGEPLLVEFEWAPDLKIGIIIKIRGELAVDQLGD